MPIEKVAAGPELAHSPLPALLLLPIAVCPDGAPVQRPVVQTRLPLFFLAREHNMRNEVQKVEAKVGVKKKKKR